MSAPSDRKYPLEVGDREAVDILFEKIAGGEESEESERYQRLLQAVERAKDVHGRDDLDHLKGSDKKAFAHGLLTGYSVAVTLLTGEEPE